MTGISRGREVKLVLLQAAPVAKVQAVRAANRASVVTTLKTVDSNAVLVKTFKATEIKAVLPARTPAPTAAPGMGLRLECIVGYLPMCSSYFLSCLSCVL